MVTVTVSVSVAVYGGLLNVAVIVCTPTAKFVSVVVSPVYKSPVRLLVHTTVAADAELPSSVQVACSVTASPVSTEIGAAGEVIVTPGTAAIGTGSTEVTYHHGIVTVPDTPQPALRP